MDTDVEVLKPYDDLLVLSGFTGYEGSRYLPPVTGTMASEAGNLWVKEQLEAYRDIHFRMQDGSLDTKNNNTRISEIMREGGFIQDGTKQVYKDMHIYHVDYFCPRQTTGEILITENTYCDHHFMGSWTGNRIGWKKYLASIIGRKNMTRFIKLKRKVT